MSIVYEVYGSEDIDLAEPLWKQLNLYHSAVAGRFRPHFEHGTFAERKNGLLDKTLDGALGLILARDTESGQGAGQCIMSVTYAGEGEVDSIFVDPEYRGRGIADALMNRALEWLDRNGARTKSVLVVAGNEEAWTFYARFGFHPRVTKLVRIEE